MGLYDRDYFREEEQPGIRARAPQTMVMTLVLINVAIYLIEVFFNEQSHSLPGRPSENRLVGFGSMYVSSLYKPWLWWQTITSGFLHDQDDIWHIIGNMFVLWMFGRDVEGVYGKREFLRFYMTTLVISSVAWALWTHQVQPNSGLFRSYGASGAVAGVLTLFILHFPRRTLLLFFVIPVPAWLVGVFLVGSDLMGEISRDYSKGGIAHSAHLAGVAFALIYFKLGWNFGRILPDRKWVPRIRRGPKLRVHDPDQRASTLDDEADAILEKVHQQGADSLTRREKRVLEDYSRRMRRKGE